MREELFRVVDADGEVYTMPSDTPKCILEIHYHSTGYDFIVQDYFIDKDGKENYPEKTIFVPLQEEK